MPSLIKIASLSTEISCNARSVIMETDGRTTHPQNASHHLVLVVEAQWEKTSTSCHLCRIRSSRKEQSTTLTSAHWSRSCWWVGTRALRRRCDPEGCYRQAGPCELESTDINQSIDQLVIIDAEPEEFHCLRIIYMEQSTCSAAINWCFCLRLWEHNWRHICLPLTVLTVCR